MWKSSPAPAACPPTLRACWSGIQSLIAESVRKLSNADMTWLAGELNSGAKIGILAGDELLMVSLVMPDGRAKPMAAARIADLLPATGGTAN